MAARRWNARIDRVGTLGRLVYNVLMMTYLLLCLAAAAAAAL